jgi:hypothetical protein
MINPLLSKAKTEEVHSTGTVVNETTKKSDYKDGKLTSLQEGLGTNLDDLAVAQKAKRKLDETGTVKENDDSRDDAAKAFKYACISLKYRADEASRNVGEKIYEIIERHGTTFYDLPYNEQTAVTLSLTEELQKPENFSYMEGTELPGLFDFVVSTNQTFIESQTDQAKEKIEQEVAIKVAEAKKATRNALQSIVDYLNAISKIETSDEFTKLCGEIKNHIDKANAVIRSRNSRGKNNDTNE